MGVENESIMRDFGDSLEQVPLEERALAPAKEQVHHPYNGVSNGVNGVSHTSGASKAAKVSTPLDTSPGGEDVKRKENEASCGERNDKGKTILEKVQKSAKKSILSLKSAHCLTTFQLSRDAFQAGIDGMAENLLCDEKVIRTLPQRSYSRDSWFRTCLTVHGRAPLGYPFHAVVVWALIVTAFVEFVVVDPVDKKRYFKLSITPFSLVGGGLMFLVGFRAVTSYGKWVESRKGWAMLSVISRDLGMQACTYVHDKRLASRICRYCIVFLLSCKCWLRCEDLHPDMVKEIMTESGLDRVMEPYTAEDTDGVRQGSQGRHLSWQFLKQCAPLVCLEVLRECIMEAVDIKKIGPFHMALESNVKAYGRTLIVFERIVTTRIPFAYISHLRTSVLLYLSALPFFLVYILGWVTVPAVSFLAYVIIGLENVSIQIENPFGYDENDLPMDEYCAEIARDLRDICRRCWKLEDNYGRGGLNDDEDEEAELVNRQLEAELTAHK